MPDAAEAPAVDGPPALPVGVGVIALLVIIARFPPATHRLPLVHAVLLVVTFHSGASAASRGGSDAEVEVEDEGIKEATPVVRVLQVEREATARRPRTAGHAIHGRP